MEDQRGRVAAMLADVKCSLDTLIEPLADTRTTLMDLNPEFARVRGLSFAEMEMVVNIDCAAAHVTAAVTLLATAKALLEHVNLAEGHSDGVAALPRKKRH
jgi:hypothetical protein